MQVLFLWAAAIACMITFCVHFFVGGVFVARPLLADTGLPKASKWLNYYCWHIASVVIVALGGAFAYSALHDDHLELAIFATGLAAAASLLSVVIALKGHINPLRWPSTSLFAATASLGLAGLFAS